MKNNEQQNIETNQNEAGLSLNNNINRNDINIIHYNSLKIYFHKILLDL